MLPPSGVTLSQTREYLAFQRYARLWALKKELAQKLKEIEPQLRALQPMLLGYLSENSLPEFAIEGFVMKPKREPWVRPLAPVSRKTVCEALKLSGLAYLVTENFSTRALTKYVKDLEEHHQILAGLEPDHLKSLLPPALASVLEVKPSYLLQVYDQRPGKSEAGLLEQELEEFEEGENE